MNIELTKRERDFLTEFAKKQHDGAKDNVGTMTPIHVVERIRTEYVENPNGDAWIWTNDYEYKAFDNFDDIFNWLTKCENVEILRNLGRYAIKCARDIEEPDDDDFRFSA